MNGVGYVLGQMIGLALIPAALIWALRGTRPGRPGRIVWDVVSPARRRARAQARARHDAFQQWRSTIIWWMREREHHPAGSFEHEAARDLVRYFETHMPPPCHCPACFVAGISPRSF